MNQEPFPKPSPAKPLPLEVWLDRTDRAEVGREAFFRGRDSEYDVFRRAAKSLDAGMIGGGTMIFQGAPGAGKSALMAECIEAVRKHSTPEAPWVAVDLNPENLASSVEVVKLLIESINAESERLSQTISGSAARKLDRILETGRKAHQELSERGFRLAGVSIGGKPNSDQEKVYSQRVFQSAAELLKNYRIVVFVDEAQTVPMENTTKGVVHCLNKPPARIPLVTAFFGLSDTEETLSKCGLSRPPDERTVSLGLLTHEEAFESIRSVFEAYALADSRESLEAWTEHLTELSQGWPQHINRVSVAACRVIRKHDGHIKGNLLDAAIEEGRKRKQSYYAMILSRCSGQPWVYRKLALIAGEKDGILSWDEIHELTQFARNERGQSTDEFLTDALHAGVLMETRELPKHYRIPVPSFGDYLRALPVDPPANAV